ncbi:MAG TPA: hypothetical protein PKC60_16105 [Hydrogenophaga sp.]|uniref:hypothetical protein n=1 Tax=Hydrogenophaga sp. TaxID=1904254 RepID=UPI002BFAAA92|nr:hypothetical protein [Hydrogenophaga sp.]HMN94753.1 hypothetical protein [Hydrogenophaga sp.]HMP12072.1 hypothetical protein [Hydrogenophaga sp.]
MKPINASAVARRSTLLLATSIWMVSNAQAGNTQCNQEGLTERISCKALWGAVAIVGYTVVTVDAIKNAITPGTPVTVELPDGSKISGSLRRSALQGRRLTQDKTVKLTCKVNPPERSYAYAMCVLEYPKLRPLPSSNDYRIRTGEQPSYWFTANAQGVPDGSLIKLERPLRWQAGVGL